MFLTEASCYFGQLQPSPEVENIRGGGAWLGIGRLSAKPFYFYKKPIYDFSLIVIYPSPNMSYEERGVVSGYLVSSTKYQYNEGIDNNMFTLLLNHWSEDKICHIQVPHPSVHWKILHWKFSP